MLTVTSSTRGTSGIPVVKMCPLKNLVGYVSGIANPSVLTATESHPIKPDDITWISGPPLYIGPGSDERTCSMYIDRNGEVEGFPELILSRYDQLDEGPIEACRFVLTSYAQQCYGDDIIHLPQADKMLSVWPVKTWGEGYTGLTYLTYWPAPPSEASKQLQEFRDWALQTRREALQKRMDAEMLRATRRSASQLRQRITKALVVVDNADWRKRVTTCCQRLGIPYVAASFDVIWNKRTDQLKHFGADFLIIQMNFGDDGKEGAKYAASLRGHLPSLIIDNDKSTEFHQRIPIVSAYFAQGLEYYLNHPFE